jgi:hypothetical protein
MQHIGSLIASTCVRSYLAICLIGAQQIFHSRIIGPMNHQMIRHIDPMRRPSSNPCNQPTIEINRINNTQNYTLPVDKKPQFSSTVLVNTIGTGDKSSTACSSFSVMTRSLSELRPLSFKCLNIIHSRKSPNQQIRRNGKMVIVIQTRLQYEPSLCSLWICIALTELVLFQ